MGREVRKTELWIITISVCLVDLLLPSGTTNGIHLEMCLGYLKKTLFFLYH